MKNENEKKVWFDGNFVFMDKASIPINAVALKYGAQVFEGIRAYKLDNEKGFNILALKQHINRLLQSCKLMRMEQKYNFEQLLEAVCNTLKENEVDQDCYIRMACSIVGTGGIDCTGPVSVSIDVFPMSRKSYENGISVCINGWQRLQDSQMPPRIKCVANYQNGRLALLQAKQDGYDNVLLINNMGKICEAPTAAIFIIRGNQIITPPFSNGILESVTREIVILIAKKHGFNIIEREIDRTEIYIADGAFLCGTGAEILPIKNIDGYKILSSENEIFLKIRDCYFSIAKAKENYSAEYIYYLT